MAYFQGLEELIGKSSSSRAYFLSLPVEIQLGLHHLHAHIHTAQQLRTYANAMQNHTLLYTPPRALF